MKWSVNKPEKQGRYWWMEHQDTPPKLVFVKQECLGMYVVGAGWAKYQHGAWMPASEDESYEPQAPETQFLTE